MTSLNHQGPARPNQNASPPSTNCSLRPDLAAFFALGSRKFAHTGQHREYGILAELRAQFGHD